MTMIQLIACIGMITGLFMVLHVSPRELSDSLFARLTAAPGSIRADINETTRRKKAGFLRREITEAQAVLAASGRADKFPMVCFTSLLCFALGACIAIAAGNAFLVPVLAVGLMLTPFWYVKLTAGSFKKDVAAELENLVFGPRKEFITMAILVLINIPLVRFINKDWYHTLVGTIPGQMVIAVCLAAVFVSFAFVVKLTQPIEYRR